MGVSIAERAYIGIKADLLGGVYRPGERLDASILARKYGASITPIREALNRLAGQRLIEGQSHQGFNVPLLSESDVGALYDWACWQLVGALRMAPPTRIARLASERWPTGAVFDGDPVVAMETACLVIARLSGNTRCYQAIEQMNAELHAVRRLEALLIARGVQDLRSLPETLAREGVEGAEAMLISYHGARREAARDLAGLMTMSARHGISIEGSVSSDTGMVELPRRLDGMMS